MDDFRKDRNGMFREEFLKKKKVMKRLLGLIMAVAMMVSIMPVTVSAGDSITAKPWYTDPDSGEASPASADGKIAAVSYIYSENSLLGGDKPWFLYSGSEDVQFEPVFFEPSGISDYGTVNFNAETAPYITYTPSEEVANQTVKFKVKASAGSSSATGDFFWTVNVGSVPDSNASDNANLSALTYQIGDGTSVSIPLESGVSDYKVALTEADYNKTVTLSGTAEDSSASVSGGQVTAGYWPKKAEVTVTAANHSTTKTYSVEFSIAQSDIPAEIYVGAEKCWDGEEDRVLVNPVYVTPGQKYRLGLDCGGGNKGYGSYCIITDVGEIGNQSGINTYPNHTAALSFTLQENESFKAKVYFYREHETPVHSSDFTPLKTIEITIIAGTPGPVAEVSTGSEGKEVYSSGGTYPTAKEALQAAWEAAVQKGTKESPATIKLLKNVNLGDTKLQMSSGNVIFQMEEGVALTGNNTDSNGGVLAMTGGTLTMESGIIENSSTQGHGIAIQYDSTFNMTGGKVSAAYSSLYAENGGEVNISGNAEIHYTNDQRSGVYLMYDSVANISGGTITCDSESNTSGVYVYNSSVNITDGHISGVRAETSKSKVAITGGTITGPVYVYAGTADLSNCDISITESPYHYYGVWVGGSGTVNLHKGVHVKITEFNGNGIRVRDKGTVNIEDGVTVEAVDRAFNGVYVDGSGSTVNISGGTFIGNQYGLYVENGGNAVLSGGTFKGEDGSIWNKGGKVRDLLAEKYAYFEGTEVSDTSIITKENILNGSQLFYSIVNGTVTVGRASITITGQPEDSKLQVGYTDRPTLTVTAEHINSATADITYQWYQKNTDGDMLIADATDASYQVPPGLFAGEYQYYCVATCEGYSVTSDIATVTVVRKTRSIEITKNPGKTYDGTPASVEYTIKDVNDTPIAGEVVVEYKAKAADDTAYTTNAPKNVGDYTVRVTAAETEAYTEAVATEDFTITAKDLTVNVTVADKPYDATNTASIENATLDGVASGDEVVLTNGTPTFEAVNVGTKIPIQFTDFAISGGDAGNYTLTQPSGVTAAITAKKITVAITPGGGTYGNVTPAEAKLTGVETVDADKVPVTLTYTGKANDGTQVNGTEVPAKAGAYTVTATISNGNYELTGDTAAEFVIDRADSKLAVAAVDEKTYGDEEFALAVTHEGDGEVTYTSDAPSVASVNSTGEVTLNGAGKAMITATLEETSNYKGGQVTVTITVVRKNAVLNVVAEIYDKTYGDEDFAVSYNKEGESDVIFTSSDTSVATVDEAGNVHIVGAGSATITLSMLQSDNYNAVSKAVTVNVKAKAITVTAEDKGKLYGEKDPDLTFKADTLVGTDELEGIVISRAEGEEPGKYEITVSQTGANPNYDITFVPGKLTIEKPVATVTVNDTLTTYSYGGDYKNAKEALRAAWEAAVNSGMEASPATLTLLESVDIGGSGLKMSSGNVVLQMEDGVALTGNVDDISGGVIRLEGGTLTMKSGTVRAAGSASHGIYVTGNGSVNITGGNVIGNRFGLYAENGNAVLSGGTFQGGQGYGAISNNGGEVKKLLSESYGYFKGTEISDVTRISDETVLGKNSLNTADGYGTVTVGKVTVTITKHPESCERQVGYTDYPVLTVETEKAEGVTADLSYQWYKKSDGGKDEAIEGATKAGYQAAPDLPVGEYSYYCVVTCGGYKATSDTATVKVVKKTGKVEITNTPDKIYDSKAAEVEYETAGTGAVIVEYKSQEAADDTYTRVAPKNVGAYTVRVSVEADDSYTEASVTKDFTISRKELTVDVKVKDKQYDGLNTAEIESVRLVGAVAGDQVTLTNGTPTFAAADVGTKIPVQFTDFAISGADAGNYTLIQPSGVTASITAYEAVKDTDYTVNSNDWQNRDFVVTAKEGYLVSTTNTVDGVWASSLSENAETADGVLKFYVKKADGAISEVVEEHYKIDKTAPDIRDCDITFKENSVKQLINQVTFGLLYKENVDVKITAGDALSGVASIVYYKSETALNEDEVNALADADWTGQDSFSVTAEDREKFIIYVKVTDNAGNVTCFASDGAEFDLTSPVIENVQGGGDQWFTDSREITFTADDLHLDKVCYTVDDGEEKVLTAAEDGYTFTAAEDGAHVYTIYAVDQLGHETSVPVTVKIDRTAPTIAATGNTSGILQQDTVALTVKTGDSGIAKVEVRKDDGTYTDITDSYTKGYPVTENGTYTFRVINDAGTTAEDSITYTMLDSRKPVVSLDSHGYEDDTWTNGDVVLSATNTVNNTGTTTLSYKIGKDGKWQDYTGDILIGADCDSTYIFKAVSESGVESDEVSITVKRDTKAPEGEVTIGEHTWRKFLNTITFGLFFKENKEVTVTATDERSGIASVQYLRSDRKLGEDELKSASWTEYDDAFFIEKNSKNVIYAKIRDHAGNETVINSDGVVIYTDAAPDTQKVTFLKTSKEDVTASVSLSGNTVAEIRNGDYILKEGTDYTVSAEGVITLKLAYMESLETGNYTLTVSYNPLGIGYVEAEGNEAPAVTKIELEVAKADAGLSVNAVEEKTYGDEAFTLEVYHDGEGEVTYSSGNPSVAEVSADGEVTLKGAGEAVITVTLPETAKYQGGQVIVTINVAPKAVKVTVDDQSKIYGEKDPEFTYTAVGLIDGDVLTGITVHRKAGEDVGEYAITASQEEGANPNYAITFVDGKLTIKAKAGSDPDDQKPGSNTGDADNTGNTDNTGNAGNTGNKPNHKPNGTSPQTGDHSYPGGWVMLMLASVGSFVGTAAYGRRKKRYTK